MDIQWLWQAAVVFAAIYLVLSLGLLSSPYVNGLVAIRIEDERRWAGMPQRYHLLIAAVTPVICLAVAVIGPVLAAIGAGTRLFDRRKSLAVLKRAIRKGERGQTMAEYGLILCLVTIVALFFIVISANWPW